VSFDLAADAVVFLCEILPDASFYEPNLDYLVFAEFGLFPNLPSCDGEK